jgi:hypothetical protein
MRELGRFMIVAVHKSIPALVSNGGIFYDTSAAYAMLDAFQ